MINKLFINLVINSVIALSFVLLNIWALENNFEETFIFLALFYGIVVIAFNAMFTRLVLKK